MHDTYQIANKEKQSEVVILCESVFVRDKFQKPKTEKKQKSREKSIRKKGKIGVLSISQLRP